MGPFRYLVEKIDGDYAHLKRVDNDDTILVALALLPDDIDENLEVIWENLEYRMAD